MLSALVSFFLAVISLPFIIAVLKHRMMDLPNCRSSHKKPTPRGGGVVFVLITCMSSILFLMLNEMSVFVSTVSIAPLISLPLALVGFLDDRFSLPVKWRYCIQFATALALVFKSHLFASSVGMQFLVLFLLVSITAVINFINFMDGLDGLVAGCMSVILSVGAFQLSASWSIWALIGSLLGFLFWNWFPAKVFMGDVGSTFLGCVFAVFVLQFSSWSESLSFLLIATPLLADPFFCVIRRLLVGQRVFDAHRLHLFQRLEQAGWSHARVSRIYIASTVLLATSSLLGGFLWVASFAFLVLLGGLWLDQNVAVPFAVDLSD